MTDDWNPNDPDATKVLYDLAMWSFDQQAELASDLAEAEIPHAWEGAELVVPEAVESQVDGIINAVEARLGITYETDLDPSPLGQPGDDTGVEPVDIGEDVPTTEYDLTDWPGDDRDALERALTLQGHPHRWESAVMLVHTSDEAVVESLLDLIEAGEAAEIEADDDDAHADEDRLPFETLTTFFLAGERLKRNPLDADGLEQLLAAVELAEPTRPPYGVDVRLWQRSCELADDLAGALVDEDVPDHEGAMLIAEELHDLLRPYI